jgi:membrane-associated protein
MFVSQGFIDLNLAVVCLLLTLAAIAGNLVGYAIGYRAGPAIFHRDDSRLFKASHVERTHAFFEKHGVKAVVLARFVPVVRTFITVVAGVGRMPFRSYAVFSTIGAVLWATGVTVLGYFLGQVAFVRDNVEVILILVVLISVTPIAIEALRHRRQVAS